MDGDGDLARVGECGVVGGGERHEGVRRNHRARRGRLGDGRCTVVVGGGDVARQVGQGHFAVPGQGQWAGVGGAGRYFRWRGVFFANGQQRHQPWHERARRDRLGRTRSRHVVVRSDLGRVHTHGHGGEDIHAIVILGGEEAEGRDRHPGVRDRPHGGRVPDRARDYGDAVAALRVNGAFARVDDAIPIEALAVLAVEIGLVDVDRERGARRCGILDTENETEEGAVPRPKRRRAAHADPHIAVAVVEGHVEITRQCARVHRLQDQVCARLFVSDRDVEAANGLAVVHAHGNLDIVARFRLVDCAHQHRNVIGRLLPSLFLLPGWRVKRDPPDIARDERGVGTVDYAIPVHVSRLELAIGG